MPTTPDTPPLELDERQEAPPRICLLFFKHQGHFAHFAYLEWKALQRLGEVTILGPKKALESEEFTSRFHAEKVKVEFFEGTEAQAVCQYATRDRFSLLFSNSLDSYWHKILPKLLWWKMTGKRKANIAGILLSVPFAYPENRASSFKGFRRFLLKHIAPLVVHRMFLIDEIGYSLLHLEKTSKGQSLPLLPDPIEPPPSANPKEIREKYHWPKEERILLAIGAMIPDKRLDLLVKAFLHASPAPHWRLVLAGKFTPHVEQEIRHLMKDSQHAGQITLVNRWLEDREINEMMEAADFLSVTYPQHFANASIFFRAIQARKNTLVAHDGWIGRYAQKMQFGIPVNVYSPEGYTAGIKALFSSPQPPPCPQWNPQAHSEEAFVHTLLTSLSREARRPFPSPEA